MSKESRNQLDLRFKDRNGLLDDFALFSFFSLRGAFESVCGRVESACVKGATPVVRTLNTLGFS